MAWTKLCQSIDVYDTNYNYTTCNKTGSKLKQYYLSNSTIHGLFLDGELGLEQISENIVLLL